MDKAQKYCSNCQPKYTIEWDEDKSDLDPLTCPFCGYEVEGEDYESEIPDEADHESWH